jgi:putative endonuclease
MFYVYILYSKSLNRFYIGQTIDIQHRLMEHNTGIYSNSYTKKTSDWELYFYLNCNSKSQALSIEKHIKKMKNRKYFENLKKFPDISSSLLSRYH